NDTICLVMTPLLLVVARRASLPAVPFLLALATSSNVGSAMTITGNPQNMLIGQSSHWTWAGFALRMVPIGLICLLVNGFILNTVYRKKLQSNSGAVDNGIESQIPFNKKLAVKTIVAIFALLIGFLSGAPMDMTALTCGIALLVWANRPPE